MNKASFLKYLGIFLVWLLFIPFALTQEETRVVFKFNTPDGDVSIISTHMGLMLASPEYPHWRAILGESQRITIKRWEVNLNYEVVGSVFEANPATFEQKWGFDIVNSDKSLHWFLNNHNFLIGANREWIKNQRVSFKYGSLFILDNSELLLKNYGFSWNKRIPYIRIKDKFKKLIDIDGSDINEVSGFALDLVQKVKELGITKIRDCDIIMYKDYLDVKYAAKLVYDSGKLKNRIIKIGDYDENYEKQDVFNSVEIILK